MHRALPPGLRPCSLEQQVHASVLKNIKRDAARAKRALNAPPRPGPGVRLPQEGAPQPLTDVPRQSAYARANNLGVADGEWRGEVRAFSGFIMSSEDRRVPAQFKSEPAWVRATFTSVADLSARILVQGNLPCCQSCVVYVMDIQQRYSEKHGTWSWNVKFLRETRLPTYNLEKMRSFLTAFALPLAADERERADWVSEIGAVWKKARSSLGTDHDAWRAFLAQYAWGVAGLSTLVVNGPNAKSDQLFPALNAAYHGERLFRSKFWERLSSAFRHQWEANLKASLDLAQRHCYKDELADLYRAHPTFQRGASASSASNSSSSSSKKHKRDDAEDGPKPAAVDPLAYSPVSAMPEMQPAGLRALCKLQQWEEARTVLVFCDDPKHVPACETEGALEGAGFACTVRDCIERVAAYQRLRAKLAESHDCGYPLSRLPVADHAHLEALCACGVLEGRDLQLPADEGAESCISIYRDPGALNESPASACAQHRCRESRPERLLYLRSTAAAKAQLGAALERFQSRLLPKGVDVQDLRERPQEPAARDPVASSESQPCGHTHCEPLCRPVPLLVPARVAEPGPAAKGRPRLLPSFSKRARAEMHTWDDEHRELVRMIMQHPISCLIGGAGTGKTQAIKRLLLDTFESAEACSFTNQSVVNIQQRAPGAAASTLHSFITGLRFKKLAAPLDLVIVDECSQVHELLGKEFFQKLPALRVLLVGDPPQTQPHGEGRGAFFREFLRHYPFLKRTKNYRQCADPGNLVLPNANRVLNRDLEFQFDRDTFFIRPAEAGLKQQIDRHAPQAFRDAMFLCPTNNQTRVVNLECVKRLRSEAAAANPQLWPADSAQVLNSFAPGERVIFKHRITRWKDDVYDDPRNAAYYAKRGQLEFAQRTLFVNGEQTTIARLEWEPAPREGQRGYAKRQRADQELAFKERVTGQTLREHEPSVPVVAVRGEDNWQRLRLVGTCGRVFSLGDDFVHAYAITVNTSQGTEAEHVVLYAHTAHPDALQFFGSHHLYTAITRAKKSFCFLGPVNQLRWFAQNIERPCYCYLRQWMPQPLAFEWDFPAAPSARSSSASSLK